ncbi:JmjC domain-containing protein [Burkholderia sp. A9]|uniref:JmjC domain-containing protein n=1 Tax=Burkholderia sp. A9 TaxID=1365108 RepID=UPI002E1151C7
MVHGVLRKALGDGCAIIIDNCEVFFPGVGALTEEISSSLCCQAWANLYVSPKGPSGFGCHFDDHDVFAIQIHGIKRWTIYAPTYHSPNRGDKSFHLPSPKGAPLKEYLLSTGKGLYLPFGYWHDVEAMSDISMHVTIGLDFARKSDVLTLLLEKLTKNRFFRDKVNHSATVAEAGELKERVVHSIQELDMEMLLVELRERRRERKVGFDFPAL